jgi:hypothetical protein
LIFIAASASHCGEGTDLATQEMNDMGFIADTMAWKAEDSAVKGVGDFTGLTSSLSAIASAAAVLYTISQGFTTQGYATPGRI